MRWEYRSPKEKLFLSDGKNAWFYVPGDRQVRKTSVAKLEDLRSPLAFLLGKTKLEKELDGLSHGSGYCPMEAGDTVLRGIPKALADRVGQVVLEITPGTAYHAHHNRGDRRLRNRISHHRTRRKTASLPMTSFRLFRRPGSKRSRANSGNKVMRIVPTDG